MLGFNRYRLGINIDIDRLKIMVQMHGHISGRERKETKNLKLQNIIGPN
jgi:hypothetical protein